MIVLLTLVTGLVAFAGTILDLPDDIFSDMGRAKHLRSLVLKDVEYKGFIKKEDWGYESSLDDDIYGLVFYQIAWYDNIEREIVVIYYEGKRYLLHTGSKEILPDSIFTVIEIQVHEQKEDRLLYNMTVYARNGEIFYEWVWDSRTFQIYTVDRLEASDD